MIEYKSYPKVDVNGLYIGSVFPLNKNKSGNYLLSGNCINIKIPEIPEGKVAVLNNDKTDWIYRDDNSGEYFDVDTREIKKIEYPLDVIPENYIKEQLSEYESYNKTTKAIEFNLIKYKEDKISELSGQCTLKRRSILDDQKILNIVSGAVEGYPEYLTSENVAKFIEIYKNIYHTYATKINTASTKDDIDTILQEIVFPDITKILEYVGAKDADI